MYKLLIESNLEVQHEETKITLMEGFYPKKWFSHSQEQTKKIISLTYTPDFIIKHNDYTVYIEVKGFMSDNYPIKRKLFLNKINEEKNSIFFEVYTKINYIENRCGVTRQTASSYLNQLVEAGLLEYEKIGRESIYKNIRLIDLLRRF